MRNGPSAIMNIWNFTPLALAAFILTLLACGLFSPLRSAMLRDMPRTLLPYLFTFGFTAGFVLIVRYHEFLIIFLALSLPLAAHGVMRGAREYKGKTRRLLRSLAMSLPVCLVIFEFACGVYGRIRSYGADVYLKETAGLVAWMRSEDALRGRTVATGFLLSPMLMNYCGANIVMQPQFGMEPIRRPVEEYLRILFHGTEKEMLEYCEKYGTDFLVYDRGALGPMHIYSSRYIADAPDGKVNPLSCAALMENDPDSLRSFFMIRAPEKFDGINVKYRLFKVISGKAKAEAAAIMKESSAAAKAGDDVKAARLAKKAFALDPKNDDARMSIFSFYGEMPSLSASGKLVRETE